MSSPRLLRDLLPPEFRPGIHTLRRLRHTRRVVMLGDSYTFGFALMEREGVAAQLEVELNRIGGGSLFEVVNLGRPGLNLLEEQEVLHMLTPELEYDAVVLSLGDDDAHPWSRNELARLGGKWEAQWRTQWAEDNLAAPFVEAGLARLAEETRAADVPLVVTFFQSMAASDLPVRRLRAICKSLDVEFVDLLAPFARFDAAQLIVSPVDCHPTAFAHRIAAVELSKVLKKRLGSAETLSWEQVEEVVADAEAADLGLPEPAGLVLRQLDRAGRAKASRPHRERLRPWKALLQAMHADLARLDLTRHTLERAAGDLGMLHDGVFRFARERRLAEVGATVPDPELCRLGAALEELKTTSSRVQTAFDAMWAFVDAEPPPGPSGPPALVARLSNARDQARARTRALADQVRFGLGRVQRLVDAPLEDPDLLVRSGPQAILRHLLGNLEAWRHRFEQAAAALAPTASMHVEVEVEAADQGLLNMTLFGTFRRVHPAQGQAVQHQYVVMDGRPRRYRFDPTPGALQSFSLDVKGFSDWTGAEPLDGARYVKAIELCCDDRRIPLAPGAPFVAPLLP